MVRGLNFIVVVAAACAALAAVIAPAATAETIGGNPGPQYNFVCPNSDDKPPLDCYFDAVTHLYTMCKHVKSIELIEFGYEKSTEGTNSAKSESCFAKQKLNMTRPYQAALKVATVSRDAVNGLRGLNELWLQAMGQLAWINGESDEDYKARTMRPYEGFAEKIVAIQTVMQVAGLPADEKAMHVNDAGKPSPKSRAKSPAAKAAPKAPVANKATS